MKIPKYISVICVLLSSLSFGPIGPSGDPNKFAFLQGTLSGVVFNEGGQTVPHAEISIKGVSYEGTLKSDGLGRFNVRCLLGSTSSF